MKILIAALAETANVGRGGRLQIRGVLDTWVALKGFPCVLPPMTLVLHFELSHDTGARDHALQVDVRGDDGKVLSSMTKTYQAPKVDAGQRVVDNEIIPLQLDEPVTRPGKLAFEVFWDGGKQATLELEIRGVSEECVVSSA